MLAPRRLVAVVCSFAVVLGLAAVPPVASASPDLSSAPSAGAAQSKQLVTSRPDLTSARMVAAEQGSRVEVMSLATDTSRTWVNPDGSFTTDYFSAPVQAQQSDGSWTALDDTLAVADGVVQPKVDVTDVRFSAGGTGPAARLSGYGHTAGFKWSHSLPAPSLSGDTATYANVLSGADLTETATSTGFEVSLKVASARQAAALPASFDLPLTGSGVTWVLTPENVLIGTDSAGTVVATSSGANAYDSAMDPHSDEPLHSAPLVLSLTGAAGSQVLHVATPTALLADPATVFPVTIDPSMSFTTKAWTYVDSGFPSTSYYNSSSEPAKVGTFNGGADKDRTLYFFGFGSVASSAGVSLLGKHVISASFSVKETWSWSCTKTAFNLYNVGAFSSSTDWSNQPAVGGKYATITSAAGYNSSCPAAVQKVDFTNYMVAAAASGDNAHYVELRAASETDDTYWKKFATTATISVTYNSIPSATSGLSVRPCLAVCTGTVVTNSATPTLTATGTDADGGTLTYGFYVFDSTGTTKVTGGYASAASGATASWKVPSGVLTNGTSYEYESHNTDGTDNGAYSGWQKFTVDTAAPVAPVVSSSTHPANAWTAGTTGSFSWSDASSDKYLYSTSEDYAAWSPWTSATSLSWSAMANNKEHSFKVRVEDKAGNISAATNYLFGVGTGSANLADGTVRTQRDVVMTSSGPLPYVEYQWRRGTTSATAGWAMIPVANMTAPGTATHPASGPIAKGGQWDWDVVATAGSTDGLIQIRACFYSSTTDTAGTCQQSDYDEFTLAVHAFGASYATEQVGPGQVSLITGDYEVDATDADIATSGSNLSVSRAFTTLTTPAANTSETGVFGPGWAAAFSGPDTGAAEYTLSDHTPDGYVLLTDADGAVLDYEAQSSVTGSTVTFTGMDDAADGSVLTKASASKFTLKDADGTLTTWVLSGGTWQVSSVVDPSGLTSGYDYSSGLISRLRGPVPSGITCSTPDTTAGCRSLKFTYAQIAGATRLTQISLSAPETDGVSDIVPVANYDYDSSTGRLLDEYDPRINPHLPTSYTYDSTGRLATIAPPGQAAWTLHYDSDHRVSSVSRPDAALGKTATTSIVYAVPVSGTNAPINLSGAATAGWGQDSDYPAVGAAIFDPGHVPAGTTPLTVAGTDWPYADLHYMDANGREVNTAVYGAGQWLIDTTRYDSSGNTTWQLTAANRAYALDPASDPDAAATPNSSAGAADLLATTNTYNDDRTELLDTLGPLHQITLADGGTTEAQDHVVYTYDENAPTGGPFRLVTKTVNSSQDYNSGAEIDPITTHIGYAAIGSMSTTGWALRQPTSQTDPLALATTTTYNAAGQTTETDLPANAGNSGVRSTITHYYGDGSTGCTGHPEWSGWICSNSPGAQPSTGNPLAVTTYTYDLYGDATRKIETYVADADGSTVTRTTSLSYDSAGRVIGTSIAVSPATDGGTGLPTVTDCYDQATGLMTKQITVPDGSGGIDCASPPADATILTTAYDTLGRQTSYTDADGSTATTSYDIDGNVASSFDGLATTSYVYDSASEHRGLITSEDLGATDPASVLGSSLTISYDAAGDATVTYPNGMVKTTQTDTAGDTTETDYSQPGWVDPTGDPAPVTFTQGVDAHGQVAAAVSGADGSVQAYAYDADGRLTQVQDAVPDPLSDAMSCTMRVYRFDAESNRTSLTSYADDGTDPNAGHCNTDPANSTVTTASFDQADRLRSDSISNVGGTSAGTAASGTYGYDMLGRTTTLPALDAAGIGSHAALTGDVAVGYYASDYVHTQTQGGDTITFNLDPTQDRVESQYDSASGVTTTDHYGDGSDSPVWTVGSDGSRSRNMIGPDGDLVGTVDQAGTITWDVVNPHGDVVGQSANDTSGAPVSFSCSTEYGAPRDAGDAYDDYGWLGSKLRSEDDFGGLVLMGARLYDPATGRFLSGDPVAGGNANAYIYPDDPITFGDVTGLSRMGIEGASPCSGLNGTAYGKCIGVSQVSLMKSKPKKKPKKKGSGGISAKKALRACGTGAAVGGATAGAVGAATGPFDVVVVGAGASYGCSAGAIELVAGHYVSELFSLLTGG